MCVVRLLEREALVQTATVTTGAWTNEHLLCKTPSISPSGPSDVPVPVVFRTELVNVVGLYAYLAMRGERKKLPGSLRNWADALKPAHTQHWERSDACLDDGPGYLNRIPPPRREDLYKAFQLDHQISIIIHNLHLLFTRSNSFSSSKVPQRFYQK